MVSKNARKLLRWMSTRSDEWFYPKRLRDELSSPVDSFLLAELCTDGLLEKMLSPGAMPCDEYDEPEYEYRITDKGCAELEARFRFIFTETRGWLTFVAVIGTLVVSIISVLM